MLIWRICSQRFAESAFTGKGAYDNGGRWNPPGYYVVYTSGSLSLAALEFCVNLEHDAGVLPLAAVSAEVSDLVKVLSVRLEDLASDWRTYPAPPSAQQIGARWIAAAESAVLSAPSVVIPGERNYLLNPAHPQFRKIVIYKPEPFGFDPRMWKPGP